MGIRPVPSLTKPKESDLKIGTLVRFLFFVRACMCVVRSCVCIVDINVKDVDRCESVSDAPSISNSCPVYYLRKDPKKKPWELHYPQ